MAKLVYLIPSMFFLICKVSSQECQYPIQLPEILAVKNDDVTVNINEPTARVQLRTDYEVEGYFFWITELTRFNLTTRELIDQKPQYHPAYGNRDKYQTSHVSGENGLHTFTFSRYVDRDIMLHSLVLQLNVGCQTLEIKIPIKPDEIEDVVLPYDMGKIHKIPARDTVFSPNEWINLEFEFENEMVSRQYEQFYFRNSTHYNFTSSRSRWHKKKYVFDEGHNGRAVKSGNMTKALARIKIDSDTTQIVMKFDMWRPYTGYYPRRVGSYVRFWASFHTSEASKPIVAVHRCTSGQPDGFVDENGKNIIPLESGHVDGCVKLYAFGNPTPTVIIFPSTVSKKIDSLVPANYFHTKGLYNGGIYQTKEMETNENLNLIAIALNSVGLSDYKFTLRGYEPIRIKSECVDPKCNSQGVLKIPTSGTVQLKCSFTGPVQSVSYFFLYELSTHPRSRINQQTLKTFHIQNGEKSVTFNFRITSSIWRNIGYGHTVFCVADGERQSKVARFMFDTRDN